MKLSVLGIAAMVGVTSVSGLCDAPPINMPTCKQHTQEWCWATAAAEVIGFFNPTSPSGLPFPQDCQGIECMIVGVENNLGPYACCQNPQMCSQMTGQDSEIIHAIGTFFPGGPTYTDHQNALDEVSLNAVLSKGHPVVMGVLWEGGHGGHILVLGGCENGSYRLHDPIPGNPDWKLLSYDQLLDYQVPASDDHPALNGKWSYSMFKQGDDESQPLTSTTTTTTLGSCTAQPIEMPTCTQHTQEWCWATAAAEVIGFFNPTSPTGQPFPQDCKGVECMIVGTENRLGPDACCQNPEMCARMTGQDNEIIHAIENYFPGGPTYDDRQSALDQATLDAVLSKGHPVVIGVLWEGGKGGHVLTLGGCQDGLYRVHDPMPGNPAWKLLSYDQVMTYQVPAGQGHPDMTGKWSFTVLHQGDDALSNSTAIDTIVV